MTSIHTFPIKGNIYGAWLIGARQLSKRPDQSEGPEGILVATRDTQGLHT